MNTYSIFGFERRLNGHDGLIAFYFQRLLANELCRQSGLPSFSQCCLSNMTHKTGFTTTIWIKIRLTDKRDWNCGRKKNVYGHLNRTDSCVYKIYVATRRKIAICMRNISRQFVSYGIILQYQNIKSKLSACKYYCPTAGQNYKKSSHRYGLITTLA